MDIKNLFIYFMAGGIVTTLIVMLEEDNLRLWSGLAALMPVFTLVSYVFIGGSKGGAAVGEHSKFVLAGTIVSWIPFMIVVSLLAPKMGDNKDIASGLVVFFVLAVAYVGLVNRYSIFQ